MKGGVFHLLLFDETTKYIMSYRASESEGLKKSRTYPNHI